MRNRLIGKAEVELSEEYVSDECRQENHAESDEKFRLTEQNHVTESANHAESGVLCKSTDEKTGTERVEHSRVLCAGTFLREENKGGSGKQKKQKRELYNRKPETFYFRLLIGSL